MTNHFPPLRLAVLNGLMDIKANLPSLDDPACPYDPETIGILKNLLAPQTIEKIVEREVPPKAGRGRPTKDVELSNDDKEMLTDTIRDLIKNLKEMGQGEDLSTGEQVQITKTQSGLVEQLLKMRERNTHAQRMEQFKEDVIGILNDLVTEADRETFMRRLEPLR